MRELYDDVGPYLDKHRFPAFDRQLIALEAAVTAAPKAQDTEAQYQAMIATLHKARALAPASLRASIPEMIQICSDTIDAASGEFGESLQHGQVSALVDMTTAAASSNMSLKRSMLSLHRIATPRRNLLDRFKTVLAKAQYIVGELHAIADAARLGHGLPQHRRASGSLGEAAMKSVLLAAVSHRAVLHRHRAGLRR